jgi:hypothetical protein
MHSLITRHKLLDGTAKDKFEIGVYDFAWNSEVAEFITSDNN